MELARSMWLRVETIHAVTYFGEPTIEAGRAAGLTGFWMGYFGFRAAPLGAVGRGAVEATFFNFAPSFVGRWVPDVWQHASPERLVAARSGRRSVAAGARPWHRGRRQPGQPLARRGRRSGQRRGPAAVRRQPDR